MPRYFPNPDEFHSIAKSADLVPVYRQLLADHLTPVTAFELLGKQEHALLLESVVTSLIQVLIRVLFASVDALDYLGRVFGVYDLLARHGDAIDGRRPVERGPRGIETVEIREQDTEDIAEAAIRLCESLEALLGKRNFILVIRRQRFW